jgi:retinol dehydrogenase 12
MLTLKLAKLLEGDYGANGKVVANVLDPGESCEFGWKIGPDRHGRKHQDGTSALCYLWRESFGSLLLNCIAHRLTASCAQHWLLLHPTPLGAYTQLYVATSPEAARINGKVRSFL